MQLWPIQAPNRAASCIALSIVVSISPNFLIFLSILSDYNYNGLTVNFIYDFQIWEYFYINKWLSDPGLTDKLRDKAVGEEENEKEEEGKEGGWHQENYCNLLRGSFSHS